MSAGFVAHDPSFATVTGASPELEKVVDCDAHEGPVYLDGALYATSLPTGFDPAVIIRIDLDGHRFPIEENRVRRLPTEATMPNGMALGPDGRLIVCEQGDLTHDACISSIDPTTGARAVLVSRWRNRRFNSPNDVAVGPDGSIWFTDPGYGYLQGFRPDRELGDYVYRWDPVTGQADAVADGFDKPNGIALSPDGATLYVTDSGADQGTGRLHVERPHHVVAFDVVGGRRVTRRRLLAVIEPGVPDGLKVDGDGRIYVSAAGGVLVLSPEGDLLGEILVAGAVNFTFGGPDRNVLFVTNDAAVWAATLAVAGPRSPSAAPPGAAPQPTGAAS